MSAHANPDIITNGLVFGFDTGYPLVSQSHETYRYNRGEPTTTFDVGTMVPTNPNTAFTSNATYHNNLHGTVWDWSYYPNSNISSDGGMEWVPNYSGPGFTGAWKMKKRAGGNGESNFSGAAPGAIDSSKTYTVSVWCKTDQASMARIHVNTTRSGSSYWGYGSSYHSGGGDWERLSVTIYGGEGNTSINTIRCQCNGTTINADAYWRDYQVEERSHATPFILGGTRSATGSLIDLTGTTNIDVSNASFDSNAQMTFDGTDDRIIFPAGTFPTIGTKDFTIEAVCKNTKTSNYNHFFSVNNQSHFALKMQNTGNRVMYVYRTSGLSTYSAIDARLTSTTDYYHIVCKRDGDSIILYVDGVNKGAKTGWDNISIDNNLYSSYIGHGHTGEYTGGDIPIFKLYDRALTAAEVLQNYNATKSRFT